jgi:hypothetical protein
VLAKFRPPVYPRLWGDFRYHVSALDLALDCGPKARHPCSRSVMASLRKEPARRTGAGATGRASRYWSQRVTETSNALNLESGVFTKSSPQAIARSLKRSADASTRRKGGAYQSAMSMLNFYINRAGRNLSPKRRRILERAKDELRNAFGRR